MNILYDLELEDGERLEGVYFVEYHKPIKGGKHLNLLGWAASYMNCYDKNDQLVADKNFNNAVLLKAYYDDSKEDITDFFTKMIGYKMNTGIQ